MVSDAQQLNAQQQAAVTYVDGPLLVIAGAGSGKTRVITRKIAHLIEHCGLSPKHIYAITFTNKAAKEMASRAQKKVQISTFHVLGLNILRREATHLHLNQNFTLFDANDSQHVLKELSHKITAVSEDSLKVLQHTISRWKNALISPKMALESAENESQQLAARFYCAYQDTLLAYNAVDFDDLITLPVKLFTENRDILETWQNQIRYLLVDEYQDTNTAQYQLIKQLCGLRGALTAVGDDDQSIYAWRGACVQNIEQLQTDFHQLKVVKLEQNYRSTSIILRSANHLISHNPHLFQKQLWSTIEEGEPIRILATADGHAEIERIVHEILAHKFRFRLAFHEYAILYRSNYQARDLEQALRLQGIPYQISGGISFFDRTEIKDVFAYFRLMINPRDDAAFLRCINTPKREIGPTTLEKLGAYAKNRQCSLFDACQEMGLREYLPLPACERLDQFVQFLLQTFDNANRGETSTVIEEFIKEINYYEYLIEQAPNAKAAEKRIENVRAFLGWLDKMTNGDSPITFEEAIQKMLLIDILDKQSQDQKNDAVQLMTLHAAKGLEFPHVFIMGLEEECLPHKNSMEDEQSIEEERRLAYVGMTRAQRTLVLTYAKQRHRYGESQSITPSRFLTELPPDLVEWEGIEKPSEEKQRASGQAHLAILRAMLENPEIKRH